MSKIAHCLSVYRFAAARTYNLQLLLRQLQQARDAVSEARKVAQRVVSCRRRSKLTTILPRLVRAPEADYVDGAAVIHGKDEYMAPFAELMISEEW